MRDTEITNMISCYWSQGNARRCLINDQLHTPLLVSVWPVSKACLRVYEWTLVEMNSWRKCWIKLFRVDFKEWKMGSFPLDTRHVFQSVFAVYQHHWEQEAPKWLSPKEPHIENGRGWLSELLLQRKLNSEMQAEVLLKAPNTTLSRVIALNLLLCDTCCNAWNSYLEN